MTSRQLEYFLAVARELNFTKAAESMYVSQTAVTQQIKVLEEQLGVNLFERTKRTVTLTPAGKVFQSEAIGIMNRMNMAAQRTREISNGFAGSLTVGFTVGIGNTNISERIQAFNQEYPNIAMKFYNLSPSMLLKQLKEGSVDLAFMPMFEEEYYQGIEYQYVAKDKMVVVLPTNHHLAQNPSIHWTDLKDERLIMAATTNSEVGEDKKILENMRRMGVKPNIVANIEDVETIFFMISANMGLTILPAYMAAPIATRGRMTFVPLSEAENQIPIIAGWMPKQNNPSLDIILPFLEKRETI